MFAPVIQYRNVTASLSLGLLLLSFLWALLKLLGLVSLIITQMLMGSFEKQPSRRVFRKRCSENMQQIYRRTSMFKYDFNKIANQLYWNHTSAWAFSCNFACTLSERLLLRTPLGRCFSHLKILKKYSWSWSSIISLTNR